MCSIPALSRIEACDRIPDKLLLDALMQRLGKSPDKLESIVSTGDYELYLHRERIQRCIVDENYTLEELKKKFKELDYIAYKERMKKAGM